MPCAPGNRPEPISIEISGSAVSIILTQGAINIWFGRKFDKSLIAKILILISKVDSTTEHEKEVICSFEEISEFENNGYILSSYARKKTNTEPYLSFHSQTPGRWRCSLTRSLRTQRARM